MNPYHHPSSNRDSDTDSAERKSHAWLLAVVFILIVFVLMSFGQDGTTQHDDEVLLSGFIAMVVAVGAIWAIVKYLL